MNTINSEYIKYPTFKQVYYSYKLYLRNDQKFDAQPDKGKLLMATACLWENVSILGMSDHQKLANACTKRNNK